MRFVGEEQQSNVKIKDTNFYVKIVPGGKIVPDFYLAIPKHSQTHNW